MPSRFPLSRVFVVVFASLIFVRCGDGNPSNPVGTGETRSVMVSASGGTVEVTNAKLEIPAGALAEGQSITVTSSPTAAPAQFEAYSPVFVFEPEGIVFQKPVKVTFTATQPGGSKLVVFWTKRGSKTEFEELPSTASGSIITAEVTHFS
ncbi:MAG: hypothetical protein IAE78_25400, partial [Myxococcus sp.]|nr:hypothetical protein [Myxococcus sp.]